MKLKDVPQAALGARATKVPTKLVPDWDAMYDILKRQGYVIIESDDLRLTSAGADECVPVKAFNSHLRGVHRTPLRTKRIGNNRWYCTL